MLLSKQLDIKKKTTKNIILRLYDAGSALLKNPGAELSVTFARLGLLTKQYFFLEEIADLLKQELDSVDNAPLHVEIEVRLNKEEHGVLFIRPLNSGMILLAQKSCDERFRLHPNQSPVGDHKNARNYLVGENIVVLILS